jgi:hypothetical protein
MPCPSPPWKDAGYSSRDPPGPDTEDVPLIRKGDSHVRDRIAITLGFTQSRCVGMMRMGLV